MLPEQPQTPCRDKWRLVLGCSIQPARASWATFGHINAGPWSHCNGRLYTSSHPSPSIQQGFYSFPFFRGQLSIFNGLYEDVQQILLVATRNSCYEAQLCCRNKIKPKLERTCNHLEQTNIDKGHMTFKLQTSLLAVWSPSVPEAQLFVALPAASIPHSSPHQARWSFDFPSQSPKQKESKAKSKKVYVKKHILEY